MKEIQKLTADKVSLENYLKGQGWLQLNEQITAVEIPGEGNMNFTLRIKTRARSFIIKQSRDYVEKYPQVAAPDTRVLREADFYKLVATSNVLKSKMPNLLGVDTVNHVLNLEDLGESADFSFLYQKGQLLDEDTLKEVIHFIAGLHTSITAVNTTTPLKNKEMRQLNHEHMYLYPYVDENGLNLDDILPGLKDIAAGYKNDQALKIALEPLGKRYLSDGHSLLHGDFFPGSWLKTNDGIKIIDAEFCFFGDPEFELGVMLAHLKMADQPEGLIQRAINMYQSLAPLNINLCKQYMAVELLRRILGLAQLPLTINLNKRKSLLEEARAIILASGN